MKNELLDKLEEYLDKDTYFPLTLERVDNIISLDTCKLDKPLLVSVDELSEQDVKDLHQAYKTLSRIYSKAESPMTLCDIDAALEEFQQPDIQVVLLDNYADKRISIEIEPPACSMLGNKIVVEIILPDMITRNQWNENIVLKIKTISAKMHQILEVL